MTFDEELKRALDPAADRLHAEIQKQLDSLASELSAVAREQTETAVASALRDHQASQETINDRVLDAIRAIDAGRSLNEILDALVAYASQEAARVAVLLVRGTRLHGCRFSGFGPEYGDPASIVLEITEAGAADAAAAFAELPPGQECLAVPMSMADHVVAVVYVDQGANASARLPKSTIEVLVRHASRCLEALTALKAARSLTARPDVKEGFEEAEASVRRYANLRLP